MITRSIKRLAKALDPTRPVTVAMNGSCGQGVSSVVDVQGCNYGNNKVDEFHHKFPDRPMIGTETASTVCRRGIYYNDKAKAYVSAYDRNHPGWAATAEEWWRVYDEQKFLAAGFVWTGFDYRGEPTPYSWPCISSHFGILDRCGFPKDNYFYFKAWWDTTAVLHLFPHWNWEGKEAEPIDVWCHPNLDSVELFADRKSAGGQQVQHNSHLAWSVTYQRGVIEARGIRSGRAILTAKRETTGTPASSFLAAFCCRLIREGR